MMLSSLDHARARFVRNRIKTECIVTVARFNGEWAGDQDVAWWAQLFETAGYDKGEMLAELEADLRKSGPGGEIGDPDETKWNEVLAHVCTEGQREDRNNLWNELFKKGEAA